MTNFGERLRMARERKGLSQLDVYREINLNNKSLSRYENNTTAPDPETIRLLIDLYDVSANFLFGLTDQMGSAQDLSKFSCEQHFPVMERELLKYFRRLTLDQQRDILIQLKALADADKNKR